MTIVSCRRVANHYTKMSQIRATTNYYVFLSTNWLNLYTKEEGSVPIINSTHLPEGRAEPGMPQGGPFSVRGLAKEHSRDCGNCPLMTGVDLSKPTLHAHLVLQCHSFFSLPTRPLQSSKEDR